MTPQLIDELNIDISSLKLIVNDVAILLGEVDNLNPSNIHKSALGAFVSQFYNGVENVLKRIHKANNLELPKGDDWHIKLIERFSDDSEIQLPIKLSKDLIEKLTNYRRFRHYFFHGYSHNLNWDLLRNGVEDIEEVLNQFISELFPNQQ